MTNLTPKMVKSWTNSSHCSILMYADLDPDCWIHWTVSWQGLDPTILHINESIWLVAWSCHPNCCMIYAYVWLKRISLSFDCEFATWTTEFVLEFYLTHKLSFILFYHLDPNGGNILKLAKLNAGVRVYLKSCMMVSVSESHYSWRREPGTCTELETWSNWSFGKRHVAWT